MHTSKTPRNHNLRHSSQSNENNHQHPFGDSGAWGHPRAEEKEARKNDLGNIQSDDCTLHEQWVKTELKADEQRFEIDIGKYIPPVSLSSGWSYTCVNTFHD
jgi:hypothetical protein